MRKFAVIFLILLLTAALFGGVVSFASAEEAHDVLIELTKSERDGKLYVTANLKENDGINALYLRVEFDEASMTLADRTFGSAGKALDAIDQFDDPVDPATFEYPYTPTLYQHYNT